MARTHTYTFAGLEVSETTFNEIKEKLLTAGYQHAFVADGDAIDMSGIGLVMEPIRKTKFCDQCDVLCVACAHSDVHMNIEPPFPGYTHDDTAKVDWYEHNSKGHHHVVWNGVHNEVLPCGSEQLNQLYLEDLERRKREGTTVRSDPNSHQVGGSHYGGGTLQHWDLAIKFKWDFLQGQIIKYVMRWRDKNGVQDLEKARHNLDKYIDAATKGDL